jgi:hypothetical protein
MAFQHHGKSTLNSRKFAGNIFHSFLTICRAGGGGNKQNRQTKISEKNQKLNEQRIKRMHEEEKAKLVKRDLAIDHSDVHPSRRARVPDIS